MRVFDLDISVAAVAAYSELGGSVTSAGDLAGDLGGEVLSSDALDSVVQPRGVTQCVAMELYFEDELVSRQSLKDELWVERDYDNLVQAWGLTTPLPTPTGVFGAPFACVGPALGTGRVSIVGVYYTDSGVVRIPLITDGIVDNSHRESGEGGIFETFNGVDRGGRYDGVKVTKQFPPGHGLPRGRVLREVLLEAGETQTNFEDGNRMDKELQLVDTEPFSTLAEIAETENRKLLWSDDGFATNPKVGRVRPDETPVFSFEERDLLRISSVSLDPNANVITLVVAHGSRQKTKESCGLVWTTETRYTYSQPYTIRRSAFLQDPDGSYSAIAPNTASTTPVLTKKVETMRAHRCDTLVEEIVRTWEMARTEVPRHEWEGGDGSDPEIPDGWRCLPVYTDDNNGVGGGPAYEDLDETLRLVNIVQTKYFYIHQSYGSVSAGGLVYLPKWDNQLMLPPGASYKDYAPTDPSALAMRRYGQAQGSVTFVSSYQKIGGSIKNRGPFGGFPLTPWSEVEPTLGQLIWGDGSGVSAADPTSVLNYGFIGQPEVNMSPGNSSSLIPWSISCSVFYGDEENFLTQEDNYTYGWAALDGDAEYWGENSIKDTSNAAMMLTEKSIKVYLPSGNQHSERIDITNEITGHIHTEVLNGLPNHLPAIERLDIAPISDEIYEDGEREEFAAPMTQRSDTEQITVTMPFDFFLTCHIPREVVVDFPWAENEDELADMCEALAQESAAMPVNFSLPAHFLIREAQPIHLLYRPLGIDHDLRVKSVRNGQSPGQAIITKVVAKLYQF